MESNGGLDSNDVNGDLFSARQLTMEIVDELNIDCDSSLWAAMLRNLLSRGLVCVDSIHSLVSLGRIYDASILCRTLIDIAIVIDYTDKKGNVEGFRYYSLRKRERLASKLLNDPNLSRNLSDEQRRDQINWKKRAQKADKPEVAWEKPGPEDRNKFLEELDDVSRSVVLSAYDAPSMESVHPLFDTGLGDLLMTKGALDVTEQHKLEMLNQTWVCLMCLLYCSVVLAVDRLGHRYARFLPVLGGTR